MVEAAGKKGASVKWQDLIELHGQTPDAVKRATEALDKFGNSQTGQKLLKEWLDLKNAGFVGNELIPTPLIASLLRRDYPTEEVRTQLSEIRRSHKDPTKLLLYAEDGQDSSKSSSPLLRLRGTAHDALLNIMVLDVSGRGAATFPMTKSGVKSHEAAMPLDQLLAHELKHPVDARLEVKQKARIEQACKEYRADEVENAYRKETGQRDTQRYAYVDPAFNLGYFLDKNPQIKVVVQNPNNSDDFVVRNKLVAFQFAAKDVVLNSGCSVPTQESVVRQAMEVLKNNGIAMDGVTIPPQAIPRLPGQLAR